MRENEKKCMNAILFLCGCLDGKIEGKKKLYKLLYYIDFDNYEYNESMASITGNKYIAWKMGPVPEKGSEILERMQEKNMIKIEKKHYRNNLRDAEVYIAQMESDLNNFTENEIFIMKRVARKYGGLTGKQLEYLTHSEAPYIATAPNEEINYGLAFYRGTNFYDELARV